MRYVKVTILHQPDAGQHSTRRFTYPELLGHTDETTGREFAYKALAEGNFRIGRITVTFPEASVHPYRFERTGLLGYKLTRTLDQPNQPPFA